MVFFIFPSWDKRPGANNSENNSERNLLRGGNRIRKKGNWANNVIFDYTNSEAEYLTRKTPFLTNVKEEGISI